MNNLPLVSVIIPTYNCVNYISRAIHSVLFQTYPNIEIIVVNDGSTDDTSKLLDILFSNKITVINQVNKGVAAARNAGIKVAKGKYIAMLDADDIFLNDRISEAINIFQSHKGFCFFWALLTNNYIINNYNATSKFKCDKMFKDKHKIPDSIDFDFVFKNTLAISNIIIPTDLIRSLNGYDCSLKIGEDYDLLLRITRYFGPIYYINKPLATIMKRKGSLSSIYQVNYRKALNKMYKQYHIPWLIRLFYTNYHFVKYTAYMIKNRLMN